MKVVMKGAQRSRSLFIQFGLRIAHQDLPGRKPSNKTPTFFWPMIEAIEPIGKEIE